MLARLAFSAVTLRSSSCTQHRGRQLVNHLLTHRTESDVENAGKVNVLQRQQVF
jgi:hypothetical protein